MSRKRIEFETAAGNIVLLPTKNELCRGCDGDGTIGAEGWNGVAFTESDLAQMSPEEIDQVYGPPQQQCSVCNGQRVCVEVDAQALSARDPAVYAEWAQARKAKARRDAANLSDRRILSLLGADC